MEANNSMIVAVTRDSRDPARLVVAFSYDPSLTAAVKSVPGRPWDPKRKVWTLPDTPENVLALWRALPKGAELSLPPTLKAQLRDRQDGITEAQRIRDAGDHETDFKFVTEPYAHQRAGLGFLQRLGGGALLWEMGLGKTKTALDYCESLAQTRPDLHVLVISPNTVTGNWLNEIAKHTRTKTAVVLTGTLKARAKAVTTPPFPRYTIVNTEALSLDPLAGAIIARAWHVVIVDESTRFKSPKARRTKNLHKVHAEHKIILTGTPITQSAEDAWAQFEFLQPGLLGSWWHFLDHYLVKDYFGNVVGLKPGMGPELAKRIESRSYRKLKSEVLDLPPKVYADRVVELTGDQAKAYQQMKKELMVQIAEAPRVTASTILTQLLRLTQITAGMIGARDSYLWLPDGAKLTELDHLLNEELAGEQVVVFGLYQLELEELARRYVSPTELKVGHAYTPIIYGPTPAPIRTQLIDEFQAGRRRLLFIQSRTGGIGINLTAAKTAIYYTRGWSLEDYLQSQDRLHRIGQTGTVTILHLVAKGTVDEDIAKALSAKQDLADQLTGDDARKLAASVLGGTK
jgi:SNF2 family DNA or RNA helicase